MRSPSFSSCSACSSCSSCSSSRSSPAQTASQVCIKIQLDRGRHHGDDWCIAEVCNLLCPPGFFLREKSGRVLRVAVLFPVFCQPLRTIKLADCQHFICLVFSFSLALSLSRTCISPSLLLFFSSSLFLFFSTSLLLSSLRLPRPLSDLKTAAPPRISCTASRAHRPRRCARLLRTSKLRHSG